MAIQYIDAGSVLTTGSSRTISYPTTTVAGNILLLVIANKDGTDNPSTPSGWTAISNNTESGGAGTVGTTDEGTARVSVFYRIADGSEGGTTFTFTLSGAPKPVSARIFRLGGGPGTLSYAAAKGSQNTGGSTTYSITTGSNLDIRDGDTVFACSAINSDDASYTGHTFSTPGVTYGLSLERQDGANNNSAQLRFLVAESYAISGASTGATTYSATGTVSGTNHPAGATVIFRIREEAEHKVVSRASFTETVATATHPSSITLPEGTRRKLVVCVSTEFTTQSITGGTFEGAALTLIQNVKNSNGDIRQWWYYYDIPDGMSAGSKTISWTTSASVSSMSHHAWILQGSAAGPVYYSAVVEQTTTTATITNSNVARIASGVLLVAGTNASVSPVVSAWSGVNGVAESNESNYTSAAADLFGLASGTGSVSLQWNGTSGEKLLGTVVVAKASASQRIRPATIIVAQPAFTSGTGSVA